MIKQIIVWIAVAAASLGLLGAPASAEDKSTIKVYIDGELLAAEIKEVADTTYVPLRAFCDALGGAEISWNEETWTADVTGEGLALSVRIGAKYLEANGRYFYLPVGCLMLDDATYVPVRALAWAFGCELSWNGEEYAVYLKSGGGPVQGGADYYNEDAVYWLARIIYAESGFEPLAGQIAVGNVVLNRVESSRFPNTIYEVVFDQRFGSVQFSPVKYGTIYREPSALAVVAAKLCLEDFSTVGESIYFLNPRIASSAWFDSNLTKTAVIGNHTFYM